MLKRIVKMIFRLLIYLFISGVIILGTPRLVAWLYARPRIYSPGSVPPARVAVVLGAGLQRDGTPQPVLQDRVETAAELYFAGKVEKLLMSGDNRFIDYNEPGAMQKYAISLGVPEEDIVLDYAGRRTYDTCYRARTIFGLDQAIIVTQDFHLPRALFLCNTLGLPAVGVSADRRVYRKSSLVTWNLREMPATLVAFWEALVSHPLPVLGEPEPIFPQK
jgi:SanA protein